MKKRYRLAATLLAALFLFFLARRLARGFYLVSPLTAVSSVLADVQGDEAAELVALSRSFGRTPYGFHGKSLLVLEEKSVLGFRRIISEFDLEEAKPLKVMAGDVNRDGSNEVSVMVYKTAEFHPVYALRPFFFNVSHGKLEAIWLGSRLSQPFVDYFLLDVNGDGFEEIVALEQTRESFLIASYSWESFGFVCDARSDELDSLESVAPLYAPDGRGLILAGLGAEGERVFAVRGDKIAEDPFEQGS